MVDIDPYDPALKYPQEWGRQSRLGALKCWRDGDKTRAIYWMKDHEWKVTLGVDLLTTKDVTKDLMSQVEWALSDKENTFTALNRTEGGLLYSKNGNEHLKQDYYQKIESTLAVCLSDPRTGRERNGLDGKDSPLHLL